jgi:hypothetical protein
MASGSRGELDWGVRTRYRLRVIPEEFGMPKRAAVQSSKHPQDRRQPRQFGSGVGKVGSKNADSIINRPSAGLASQASVSPKYAVCALRSLPLINCRIVLLHKYLRDMERRICIDRVDEKSAGDIMGTTH